MTSISGEVATVEQHRDHFRGRCALALQHNAKITAELANAIRISPMKGCVDVGTIEACRSHIAEMSDWINRAEDSARAIKELEER